MLENQYVCHSMLQPFYISANTGLCQAYIVFNLFWRSLMLSKPPEVLNLAANTMAIKVVPQHELQDLY